MPDWGDQGAYMEDVHRIDDDEETGQTDITVEEVSSFSALNISPDIVGRLQDDNITEPTEIQWRSIPLVHEGLDVMAEAETGSGKTLAFGLPIMETVEGTGVQAIILSPTRELAKQIARSFRLYSGDNVNVVTIYGGVGYEPQIEGAKTANVVVGTPGRVLDLLKKNHLDISGVDFFVLDEADRMLDMGFRDELEAIINFLPNERQNLLFGATIPPDLTSLCERYNIDPEVVRVEKGEHTAELRERYLNVDQHRKISTLLTLLKKADNELTLVFCRTKNTTRFVAKALRHNGVDAQALNGDMSQHQREALVKKFKDKEVDVVVATDVAARGLHIDNVSHVFNYDVPDEPDTYTHRIGRTGRQGAVGDAITFVEKDQRHAFDRITRHHKEIEKMDLSDDELVNAKIP